jgi:glycosyltransferase involved in cell wall biosynthesis
MIDATGQAGSGHAPEAGPILVVAPQPFYSDRGTPIAIRHLLEALTQLGYRVDVITYPMGKSIDLPAVRYYRVANPLKLKSVPIGFSLRKLFLDSFVLFELRRRLLADEYVCVHAVEEAAFLAVPVARFFGLPVVYDMQSSLSEQMAQYPLLRNRAARWWLDRCERWLVRHADFAVTSAGLGDRARAAGRGARVREWHYPSPVAPVDGRQVDAARASLGIGPEQRVVLYTGNFEEYQGLMNLVRALPCILDRVPQTVLVLVGAERADASRALQKRLAELTPPAAYRILERQPREIIPGYLALADVVVSPRVFGSNLPLKLLEYLAAGRAIVATAIPAHRTVLDEERALLVEPTSAALGGAILELLENPERARRLEEAARSFAERHLDWLTFVHSVGELFTDVRAYGRG